MRTLWYTPWLLGAGLALTAATTGCDDHRSAEPADAEHADAHNHAGHAHEAEPAAGTADWCDEHGVPESVCTRCNPSLIAGFKQRGDWCEEHGLPESQCVVCNPELRARFAAMRPKTLASAEAAHAHETLDIATTRRVLTPPSDPHCEVETLEIRFADRTIADKAGIRTTPVDHRRMVATLECPATIAYDATRLAHIAPRVPGVIQDVRVTIGTQVAAGDVLTVIESAALGQAKSRFIELRQNHKLAQADHDRVQSIADGLLSVLKDCTIEASAAVARERLATVRLGEPKSRLLNAHARLELARATFAREQRLREQKLSTDQAFEQAENDLHAAEAEFHAVHEEITFTSERDRLAAERNLAVARGALDAANRQLHLLGLSEAQISAIGAEPDEMLGRYALRAPVAGQVVQLHAAVGESVQENEPIVTVADLSTMWLLANVPERDAAAVQPGLPVRFAVDGLPGGPLAGTIEWISSEVDERTRTVQIRASLPNANGHLRANLYGQAHLVLRDVEQAVAVPEEAIQTDGDCLLVFVRQADDLFVPRKITPGVRVDGHVEIVSGLVIGESVVTTGSFLLKTEILKSNIGAGCCEVDPGR